VDRLAAGLVSPAQRLSHQSERLSGLVFRLRAAAQRSDQQRRTLSDRAIARMCGVMPELSASRARVQRASASLDAGYRRLQALRSARLASLEVQCRALSPEQTLSRGYAIVRTQQGSVVRSSREVSQTDLLEVRFAAGAADVQVLALKHTQDGS